MRGEDVLCVSSCVDVDLQVCVKDMTSFLNVACRHDEYRIRNLK